MSNHISNRRKWILLFVDILICLLSVFTTYYIKYKVNHNIFVYDEFYQNCVIMLILSACLFLLLRTYEGILDMTTLQYSLRVVKAVALITLVFFILNRAVLWYDYKLPLITWRTLFVNAILVSVLLIIYRVIFKYTLLMLKTLDTLIKGQVRRFNQLNAFSFCRHTSYQKRHTIAAFGDKDAIFLEFLLNWAFCKQFLKWIYKIYLYTTDYFIFFFS